MDPTEKVLVVPAALLERLGYFQGFTSDVDRYLSELLSPTHTCYRLRGEVETDPRFKQLIPYVIFCYRREGGELEVFQYLRGTGQGEGRLHRKRSVGIGGHICTRDAETGPDGDFYEAAMQRELAEEVLVATPYTRQCVGLINDDLTDVGRVHLGVVYRFDVERPDVHPREPDMLDSGFWPLDRLRGELESFETWSQLCIRALFGTR